MNRHRRQPKTTGAIVDKSNRTLTPELGKDASWGPGYMTGSGCFADHICLPAIQYPCPWCNTIAVVFQSPRAPWGATMAEWAVFNHQDPVCDSWKVAVARGKGLQEAFERHLNTYVKHGQGKRFIKGWVLMASDWQGPRQFVPEGSVGPENFSTGVQN